MTTAREISHPLNSLPSPWKKAHLCILKPAGSLDFLQPLDFFAFLGFSASKSPSWKPASPDLSILQMFLLHIQAVDMELSIFLMKMGLYLLPDSFSPEKEGQDMKAKGAQAPQINSWHEFQHISPSQFPPFSKKSSKGSAGFSLPVFGIRCSQGWEQLKGREEERTALGLKPEPEHFRLPAHPAMA